MANFKSAARIDKETFFRKLRDKQKQFMGFEVEDSKIELASGGDSLQPTAQQNSQGSKENVLENDTQHSESSESSENEKEV